VVRVLVEMLAPYKGRVSTPAAARAACSCRARSSSRPTAAAWAISIYGQESNHTTWRLAKMNLAIRGIDATWPGERRQLPRDLHKDLKADYVLANPPFNDSDWGGDQLRDDVRWKFGTSPGRQRQLRLGAALHPPPGPHGMAGFVLANGSMSSNQSGEGEIRRASSRPTWSIAWSPCRGSCSIRRRSRSACGS
jgi:type I restriction enzyme M protein